MLDSRIDQFDQIVKMRKDSTEALMDYWIDFSLYTTLEYWFMVALLLVPLLVLFLKIDKSKIFLIGFFGYSCHVISFYINLLGINMGMWHYPIHLFPSIPSFSIDASLVPVTLMLIYQWSLNKKKNYYLYALIFTMFFSFVFEPIIVSMGLFKLYGDVNYLFRFINYALIAIIAKLITDAFLWIQEMYRKSH
ncbi:hypothetical protein JOC85_004168 [Bacillus mesophilus]|uniref:Uncharacterized protein n=1 Tax=Bacillus mesophilus TaxID=1808955 RepID=A0A6M0QEE8_9BACI|nr:CBO0543 family protein [Bacillus mesophilus]MBM7663296.1 hypothetical protein [Bacillus mesophilus]NEY74080.1 hypothetical protein [Bacillus mesophilus]